ncbi:MAG: hypothetical protein ACI9VR_000938 [Cognaticolwellia sp.]|jgi:hypothetical protein
MWPLLIASALAQSTLGQSSSLPQDRVALLPQLQGWSMTAVWHGDRIVVSDGMESLLYQASDLSLLDSHRVSYWGTALLSQDGSTWVTSKRRTRVWDTESLDKLAGLSGSTLAINPTGGRIAQYGGMGVDWIRVQDEEWVSTMELWPQDDQVHWVDKDVLSLSYGEIQRISPNGELRSYPVSDLSQSMMVAGQRAYLPTWNGNLQSVDLDSGQLSWIPVHQLGAVLALSPDGELLAYVESGSGRVMLFDLKRQRALHALAGNAGGTQAIVFSPDSSELLTLGYDQLMRVHQVDAARLSGAQVAPLDMAFDGDQIHIARSNGRVEQWNTQGTLQTFATLPVQAEGYASLRFLSGGDVLYASNQGSVSRVVPWSGKVVAGPYPGSVGDTQVALGLDGSYASISSGWLQSFEADGTLAGRSPSGMGAIQLGPRGAEVLQVTSDMDLVVYDLLHGRSRAIHRVEEGVRSAQITASGAYDNHPDSGALRVNFIDGNGDQYTWNLHDEPELIAEAGEFWVAAADFSGGYVVLADDKGHMTQRTLDGTMLHQAQLPMEAERYIIKLQVHTELPLVLVALDDYSIWLVNLSSGDRQLLDQRLPGGIRLSAQGERAVWVSQGVVILLDGDNSRVLDFDGLASAAGLLPDGSVVVADSKGALSRLQGDAWSTPIPGLGEPAAELLISPSGVVVRSVNGQLERRSLDLSVEEVLSAQGTDAAQAPDGRIIAASPYVGVFEVYPGGAVEPIDLKNRHAQALSGPVAACPDGIEVLAMDWGWRGDLSLATVELGKVKPLDLELPQGIRALACTQDELLIGHESGAVFRSDRQGSTLVGILPGNGSPVAQLLVQGDILWVSTQAGVVQRYSLASGQLMGQDMLSPQQVLGAAPGGSL